MTKKQAIKLLKRQHKKLGEGIGVEIKDAWMIQTRSLINHLFGEDSDEYKFIKRFTLDLDGHDYSDLARIVEMFLDNCAETIIIKGVYKKPKSNSLTEGLSNFDILKWIAGIALTFLILGYIFGAYSNPNAIIWDMFKHKTGLPT